MKALERMTKINVALLIALFITIGAKADTIDKKNICNKCMVITNLDYQTDIVTCETSTGFIFEFYGCEDYFINDIIICTMDNKGTKEIFDDEIIDTSFSGFCLEQSKQKPFLIADVGARCAPN